MEEPAVLSSSSPASTGKPSSTRFDRRYLLRRFRTTVISNSSVVVAVIVLGGLYVVQAVVADWLTDDEIIDDADIVAASTEPGSPLEAGSCDRWLLTFADEFDGDSVDEDSWIVYNSPAPDGNGTRQPDAVTVVDGNLVVTAQMVDDELVLGRLAGNHQQTFGRIEARVRTELDPSETIEGVVGTWPAGNDHPDGGEIAFYRTPARGDRQPFYSYVHHPDGTPEEVIHNANAQDWHEIAVEWEQDRILVYRDGEQVGGTTDDDFVPDQPHVIVIGLEADKPMLEEAEDAVVRLFVDWVRLYQRNESPGDDC
jgi:beta-glucanase (GH16 family)